MLEQAPSKLTPRVRVTDRSPSTVIPVPSNLADVLRQRPLEWSLPTFTCEKTSTRSGRGECEEERWEKNENWNSFVLCWTTGKRKNGKTLYIGIPIAAQREGRCRFLGACRANTGGRLIIRGRGCVGCVRVYECCWCAHTCLPTGCISGRCKREKSRCDGAFQREKKRSDATHSLDHGDEIGQLGTRESCVCCWL